MGRSIRGWGEHNFLSFDWQNTSESPLYSNCCQISGHLLSFTYCYLPYCVSYGVSLQCRWGSEALCDLQHCSGIWLRRALQPVQLVEGAGAPLPADIPGPAQRLPQRQACLPCPRTDALAVQIEGECTSIFLVFIRLWWGHSFYMDCLFCTRSDFVNVKWRGQAEAGQGGEIRGLGSLGLSSARALKY